VFASEIMLIACSVTHYNDILRARWFVTIFTIFTTIITIVQFFYESREGEDENTLRLLEVTKFLAFLLCFLIIFLNVVLTSEEERFLRTKQHNSTAKPDFIQSHSRFIGTVADILTSVVISIGTNFDLLLLLCCYCRGAAVRNRHPGAYGSSAEGGGDRGDENVTDPLLAGSSSVAPPIAENQQV
jgi:amino acid transporter